MTPNDAIDSDKLHRCYALVMVGVIADVMRHETPSSVGRLGQEQTSAGFRLADALTYLHASGTEVRLPMNSSEEQKGMTR